MSSGSGGSLDGPMRPLTHELDPLAERYREVGADALFLTASHQGRAAYVKSCRQPGYSSGSISLLGTPLVTSFSLRAG